jgi:two-component system, cell cycle sensor histidine kinase and response regulator CckA
VSVGGGPAVAKILLVEDDEQVRVLAESFLQTAGHTTLSAATPEQALAVLATEETVDLIFVDVSLQGDSQAGLTLAANAVEKWPNLKVLYTSGQGITDGMIALFVKDSAYLPKPYTVEQLGTMLSMKFDLCASSQPNGVQ